MLKAVPVFECTVVEESKPLFCCELPKEKPVVYLLQMTMT